MLPLARESIQQLRASLIREVANAGHGRADVLPFWFGEPDVVTPPFIREAAKQALDAGDTFYTPNLGLTPLREALAAYASALHAPVGADRIGVTSSGISALMLAAQLLIGAGDRVVVVTPVWPNLTAIPQILGADLVEVPLDLHDQQGGAAWQLDTERLLSALTPTTQVLIVNSPNNPSGWVMPRAQQEAVLDHCRLHGIWIIADEVYERLIFTPGERCAPSFLDIADPLDRLVVVNSFSKSWLMTGWRLGWLTVPVSLLDDLGKLIEFNSSCAPGFVQRAGLVAVEQGETLVQETLGRLRLARDTLHGRLNALPGVTAPLPPGAMYLFFRIEGVADSLAFCKQLVSEAGLGLAPGRAFAPSGEGCLRWCFAAAPERLEEGARRLESFLEKHRGR